MGELPGLAGPRRLAATEEDAMLRLALILTLMLTGAAAAKTQKAILAGGCFWCVEANFEGLAGVKDVVSGYTGGASANPTYEDHAGHYEAVLITFDDAKVSYEEIIAKFLRSTDVTDSGGQFCDRGPAYRSAIFYLTPEQKAVALAQIKLGEDLLSKKFATPVLPAGKFWPAETYHQDYYKGTGLILTRQGPMKQSNAYKFYRQGCGRDARVKRLWGNEAAFLH
jgi:peptide-methionine (S)-S-oxide reductase